MRSPWRRRDDGPRPGWLLTRTAGDCHYTLILRRNGLWVAHTNVFTEAASVVLQRAGERWQAWTLRLRAQIVLELRGRVPLRQDFRPTWVIPQIMGVNHFRGILEPDEMRRP